MTVERRVLDRVVFPEPVEALLRTLHGVGFFEDSVLVGSWVMSLYGSLFNTVYPLRTLDIDFAVHLAPAGRSGKTDLEGTLLALGYVPSTSRSGVQRFTARALRLSSSHTEGADGTRTQCTCGRGISRPNRCRF